MPLPFILAGAAIAAAGYGAKKGYNGYQDKSLAREILEKTKTDYEEAKEKFDEVNEKTTESLKNLGTLQLKIGSDFKEFRRISESLLVKLNQSSNKDLTVDIPQHQLDKIDGLAMSATAYMGKVAGAGAAGAAAAYAVYGGVMALAAASTGTPIAALSGAAAYNATMAAIGGGSLATGGFGMAGGAMVLGGVIAGPIIAIAGWAFASHAEEALSDARKTRGEVDSAISKMDKGQLQLGKTTGYVNKIYDEIQRIYSVFIGYFDSLKTIETYAEAGHDMNMVEEDALQVIGNGYQVAAILTDIITTPLFKPKADSEGNVVVNENNVVEIETDEDGMQVLNEEAIDSALSDAKGQVDNYS